MVSTKILECKICKGNTVIDSVTMEVCCSRCGFVFNEPALSLEPEHLSKQGEPSKSRTGGIISNKFHDYGLSTDINEQNKDASGNPISSNTKAQMNRIRKLDKRYKIKKSQDVGLRKALFFLNDLEEILVLPVHVVEESSRYYREVQNRRLVQGRKIVDMVAACVYASCRINSIPLSIKEISKVAGLKSRDVGVCYYRICKELQIQSEILDPIKYIPAVVNNLHLEQNVTIVATNIIKLAQKHDITAGKSPAGLVAAAIYLASIHTNKPVTQKDIGLAANVTEATIRYRCKELKKIIIQLKTNKKSQFLTKQFREKQELP